MTGAPAWVSVGTPLPRARAIVRQRGIRHLPVLDGEGLAGMLSDRNLKQAIAAPAGEHFWLKMS